MKRNKQRKIKPVNRYNALSLLSSLLVLVSSVGGIVCLFLLPLIHFKINETPYDVYAIDFMMQSISKLFKIEMSSMPNGFGVFLNDVINPVLGGLHAIVPDIFIYAMGAFVALAFIFLGISAIGGFLCLVIGYIAGGYKAPKVFGWLNFIFVGLTALLPAAFHGFLQFNKNPNGIDIIAIYSLFIPLCLLFLAIVINIFYTCGLKHAVFKKKLDKIVKARNEEILRYNAGGVIRETAVDSMVLDATPSEGEEKVEEKKIISPISEEEKVKPEKKKKVPARPQFAEDYEFDDYVERYQAEHGTPTVDAMPVVVPTKTKKPEKEESTSTFQYKPSVGLPEGIDALPSHGYSKNIYLEIAIIPDGITSVGSSCFANCINLENVYLPASITNIGYNAFFGCKKLLKINYGGTKEQWKKIKRGSNWLTSAGTRIVVCKDGSISVDPLH